MKKAAEPKEVSSSSSPAMGRGKFLSMVQSSSLGEHSDGTKQTSQEKSDKSTEDRKIAPSIGDAKRPEISKSHLLHCIFSIELCEQFFCLTETQNIYAVLISYCENRTTVITIHFFYFNLNHLHCV